MGENEKEKTEEKETDSATESPTESENTENGAGAVPQNTADYSMIMDMLKQIQENQTRLAGELASVKDAQSVLVDAGAVIHDDSAQNEPSTGVDEFIPIEELDLTL